MLTTPLHDMTTSLDDSTQNNFSLNGPALAEERFREGARRARLRTGPSSPVNLAAAQEAIAQGNEGLPAAALLVSAWELPSLPKLADLPDAWWGPCTEWLLALPESPATSATSHIARHLTRRFEEIAGWMDRNLGAPPIRAAADAAMAARLPDPACFPLDTRLGLQQARAHLLQRTITRPASRFATPPPRSGRPLRVGVLIDRLDHTERSFALLARCAQLDPTRLELTLFVGETTSSAIEQSFRTISTEIAVLPEAFAARYSSLLAAKMDVMLYAENLAMHRFPDAHLAQLRVAPLQVAFGPSTTALSQIDLLLLGSAGFENLNPRDFEERIGLLPGVLDCLDLTPDRSGAPSIWTREYLVPESTYRLVICGLPELGDLEETLARWRGLLAASPDAFILVLPPPEVSPSALTITREQVLALAETRLVLHEPAPTDHGEMAALLALADIALDLKPAAYALALEAGVPVLSLSTQKVAEMQKIAGLTECVLDTPEAMIARAAHLLGDLGELEKLAGKVAEASSTMPHFADAYALAADFCSVLEAAWDEWQTTTPGQFRRRKEPVVPAAPASTNPIDLHAEACALLAAGRPERAVPCLLSAIQRSCADSTLWYQLARAYYAAGVQNSAIESVEASLRLDEGNAAAWRLLTTLAADAGNLDLAREALALAAEKAPEHPDLPALRARVGA